MGVLEHVLKKQTMKNANQQAAGVPAAVIRRADPAGGVVSAHILERVFVR